MDCGREFALILYIQDWLSPFRTLREHHMCRHSPNKYDDEEGEVIKGVIECSWMSDNKWVIYTHNY